VDAFMRRALLLARRGWGQTAPNPMVGAVVVRAGRVIGKGYHAEFGGAHAEVVSLQDAGADARGADLYVTLEPCAHHGKTPPCVDAIIAAGIRRVVIAHEDPNPVAQGGAAKLRAAGIDVVVGVEREAAAELNAPFLFQQREASRPFVTLKLAVSLDGAMAAGDGAPRWLTGEEARKHVHKLRAGADAVAVGIGTALADDPQLTVRSGKRPRVAPRRVVFDRSARLPSTSKLARTAKKVPVEVLVESPGLPGATALAAKGVSVHAAAGLAGHLAGLRNRGVGHLLVEGGAILAGALLTSGYVDRLIIFQAPVLLGAGAIPAFGSTTPAPGAATSRWTVVERQEFGDDLMTVYRPTHSDPGSDVYRSDHGSR
jgi:diaminohydroxyphosphoribosylaminopyrimidine deaminase/5-amino-6-(5-phosphoribosylamino)uracil reductase